MDFPFVKNPHCLLLKPFTSKWDFPDPISKRKKEKGGPCASSLQIYAKSPQKSYSFTLELHRSQQKLTCEIASHSHCINVNLVLGLDYTIITLKSDLRCDHSGSNEKVIERHHIVACTSYFIPLALELAHYN